MIIHKCYLNGKSLKVVIPHTYAAALGLKAQSHAIFKLIDNDTITITAMPKAAKKYVEASKKSKA